MSDLKTNLEEILQEKETKIIPANIKKDVQIFDVVGTYEGEEGIDTSDANAATDDIVEGKTAYVNGEKITGTLSVSNLHYNGYRVEQSGENEITLFGSTLAKRIYVNQGTIPQMSINMITLAEGIGLTADKIKAGETILGVTGTYTGETTE